MMQNYAPIVDNLLMILSSVLYVGKAKKVNEEMVSYYAKEV